MNKRTLLATATLTALVLSVGTLHPTPVSGTAELAAPAQPLDPQTAQSAENPTSPQWGYAWGMDREEALVFGSLGVLTCAPFMWVGAIACGFTGVL